MLCYANGGVGIEIDTLKFIWKISEESIDKYRQINQVWQNLSLCIEVLAVCDRSQRLRGDHELSHLGI